MVDIGPKNIAIVGGCGKMGAWFARLLKSEGHQVTLIGRDKHRLATTAAQLGVEAADRVDAVTAADIVIISVPIDSFDFVCSGLAPHVKPIQKVFDLTSVKTGPVTAMHRHFPHSLILGAHPVFGPGAKGLAGQNFILTPTSDAENELARKLSHWLTGRGARVRLTSPEEHDRLMAISLGLAHFIAIVTADALVSLDRLTEMSGASGITYKALLTLVESVLSEDPALYASLQLNLPHLPEIESLFADKAEYWASLVKDGRRDEFARRMAALKSKLETANPDFGVSYQALYRLTDRG
ncbi:prephenate dehydrogenase [Dehalogenimonas alkenigignens]|uniref:Prephenate dehydrogenase n=1 Tax=Dehalogenimonas alkenigignens TaxID=1217799 RepID=A0A0W0GG28_9CHLR|nr:prephenate dehydrogenase [Dehalogenimonas alkenigignens]KTB47499.1 prephenate dehydrogenase [Dehalogenimonas alkenigignens]PVV83442.1 prephenate dehydrogenase [Dehalogenimonas alkenigignens]